MTLATTKKTVAKWEHGVTPDPETQVVIAVLFDIPETALIREHWPQWLPPGGIAGDGVPWTPAGTVTALTEAARSAYLDRRDFLILTGSALNQPAYEWLVKRLHPIAATRVGRQVTADTVTRINSVTNELRLLDEERGSGAVAPIVHQHLRFVIDLLKTGSYTDSVGRSLFSSAAEVSQLAGWLAYDTEQHAAAQQYWITGLRAAHSSGARAIGASILNFMSYQAFTQGQYKDAASMAEIGLASKRSGIPAKVEAMLLARRALAEARTAGPRHCARSINQANVAMDRASGAEQPLWICWFKEAELLGIAGRCFLEAGDFKEAAKQLTMAIDVQPDTFLRGKTLYMSQLAMAKLGQGELDEVCALGGKVVSLTSQLYSRRLVEQVYTLQRAMAKWGAEPRVRELSEQIRELSQPAV